MRSWRQVWSDMTQVILVRHGEVAGNSGEKLAFVGWGDLPLTEYGVLQSRAVGEYLNSEHIAAVYSSDLERARITAEQIAGEHGLEVRIDPHLREVNYGAWESLGEEELLRDWAEEYAARQRDPWSIAPPDGECYAQMWERFLPKWNQIIKEHDGETIVLVGHNGLLRMLMCFLLGAPFQNFKRVHIGNGSVSRVELDGDKVLIRCINDTHFL